MPVQRNLSNVNLGTAVNSGDGDTLRDAFTKVNDNLNSLYNGGQFLGFTSDQRLTPGYSWSNDRDTGMYRIGPGKIGFSLNGAESLTLSEDGTIKWYNSQIPTLSDVENLIDNFTGGLNSANISVVVDSGTATVTVNGLPVVSSLPTTGNYTGRIVFFNGDVWIFSNYPVGNGAGLSANPAIARTAGSDSRWVRFRGDNAFAIASVRPETAPEGTLFYETGNAKPFVFLSGAWRTLASIVTSSAPSGIEVLTVLPAVGDAANYSGRTVVVGSIAYIFVSGQWRLLSQYVSGGTTASSGGITSGAALPPSANVGELFRVTGTGASAGLYIYDGAWKTIPQYTANTITARVPTLPALPTDVTFYNPGDIIIVGTSTYILNTTKTSWDFFTPNSGSGTITGVALNPGQVGTTELAANAVTTVKIASNAIIGSKLVSNTVNTREIADNAVTSSKLATNSITTVKIQNNSITGDKIAGNTISGSKILTGSIGRTQLAPNIFTGVTISANNLSEISTNLGTISTGVLRSNDNRFVIDLNNKSIRIEL
jgi:hypothetical protein